MSLVEEEDFLLYKWQAGWGLPSIDPASTQAEVCMCVVCVEEREGRRLQWHQKFISRVFLLLLSSPFFFFLSLLLRRSISASHEFP